MPASHRHHLRVAFADTDAAGIVHFSNYLRYLAEAEEALARKHGIPYVETGPQGLRGWPRVRVECDYRQPLRHGDEVDIDIAVDQVGETSLTYRAVFLRHDGVLVAEARMVVVRAGMAPDGRVGTLTIDGDLRKRLAGG